MSALITPNVKGIVLCDEAFDSDIESNVFTLEGVRQEFIAPLFPHERSFWLFLQLECARAGSWNGNVRFIHTATDRESRRRPLILSFDQPQQLIGTVILLEACRVPLPGRYNIEVWFWDHEGREVLKGERMLELIEGDSHE